MRKGILILMASALVFGAVACKSDKKSSSNKKEDTETSKENSDSAAAEEDLGEMRFSKEIDFVIPPITGPLTPFVKVGYIKGRNNLLVEGYPSQEPGWLTVNTYVYMGTMPITGGQFKNAVGSGNFNLILLDAKGAPIDSIALSPNDSNQIMSSLANDDYKFYDVSFSGMMDKTRFNNISANATHARISTTYPDNISLEIQTEPATVKNTVKEEKPQTVITNQKKEPMEVATQQVVVEPEPKQVEEPKQEQVFTAVEQRAEFPGGEEALNKWRSSNIRYPQSAIDNGISGRVVVRFVVEKDGSVSNVTVLKGVDKDLDAEAIRVVKRMPKWTPAKNNGHPVRSYFTLPVLFSLPN